MLIARQRERGPSEPLKVREQKFKEAMQQMENNLERQKRREMRHKRLTEDRTNLGLDIIDPRKKQQLMEEKFLRQL